MVASCLLKLRWSSLTTGLHSSRRQQQVRGGNFGNASSCVIARMHAHTHVQVKILGDVTQELTIAMINKLSHELNITTTSFAPTRVVVRGGAVEVAT